MENLLLGYIIGSFSLDGTTKILSKSNLTEIRYKICNKVMIAENEDGNFKEMTVSSFRHSGDFDFVKFEEVNTKEEADALKGYIVVVPKDNSVLKEGYYFYTDLEKCNIVFNNEIIGKVIKVEEFPAQVTLRVKHTSGKEFFIPFIKEFINEVSLEKKEINVNIIEGMI